MRDRPGGKATSLNEVLHHIPKYTATAAAEDRALRRAFGVTSERETPHPSQIQVSRRRHRKGCSRVKAQVTLVDGVSGRDHTQCVIHVSRFTLRDPLTTNVSHVQKCNVSTSLFSRRWQNAPIFKPHLSATVEPCSQQAGAHKGTHPRSQFRTKLLGTLLYASWRR